MNITKDTKLKDLQEAYPTLLAELKKEEPRLAFFETLPGKMLLKKATVEDISKKAGEPVELLIQGLEETIAKIEAEGK